jgi:hypothetical protein
MDVGARKKSWLGQEVALMTRRRLDLQSINVSLRSSETVRSRRSESWSVFTVGAQIGR